MNVIAKISCSSVVAGRGMKEACVPGGTLQVAVFGGAKIWNYEIWPLLTN